VQVISGSGGDDQTFFGPVKGFDPQKGWGFISCDLASQTYGKDVFLTGKQLPGGLAPEGTQVQFTVRMEEKGPAAQNVRILSMGKGLGMMGMNMGKGLGAPMAMQQWPVPPMWGKGAPAWGAFPSYGMPNPMMWGAPSPMMWGGGGAAFKDPDENSTYFGTMKTLNAEKGWGHIECTALKKLYGKDMFVMKSSLEGVDVSVGQEVEFSVAQGSRGPHAVNIRPFAGQASPDQTFTGIIKSYNSGKGWGFIESEGARQLYKQDVFVHAKECDETAELTSGANVQFTVDIRTGRPAAKNVVIL
jgi:cold shock CspA family protein